jgi:adenylyltransferase/sulfurtransferase
MCGRSAIQITPPGDVTLPLARLQDDLASLGRAEFNGHILKLFVDSYEIIVFPDGRAIVKGTTDEAKAKGLYARYIGT